MLLASAIECLGAGRLGPHRGLGQAQRHRDRQQALLYAVMEVALQAPAFRLRGSEDVAARLGQLAHLEPQLGREPLVREGESRGGAGRLDEVGVLDERRVVHEHRERTAVMVDVRRGALVILGRGDDTSVDVDVAAGLRYPVADPNGRIVQGLGHRPLDPHWLRGVLQPQDQRRDTAPVDASPQQAAQVRQRNGHERYLDHRRERPDRDAGDHRGLQGDEQGRGDDGRGVHRGEQAAPRHRARPPPDHLNADDRKTGQNRGRYRDAPVRRTGVHTEDPEQPHDSRAGVGRSDNDTWAPAPEPTVGKRHHQMRERGGPRSHQQRTQAAQWREELAERPEQADGYEEDADPVARSDTARHQTGAYEGHGDAHRRDQHQYSVRRRFRNGVHPTKTIPAIRPQCRASAGVTHGASVPRADGAARAFDGT